MTPYTKQITELHKIHKAIENCGCNKDEQGGGSDEKESFLMSLIPNDCPKPDLFVYQKGNNNPIDVTNYKIDDLINLYEKGSELRIACLYESSNFNAPIVKYISFSIEESVIYLAISPISSGKITTNEGSYNNKTYYLYYEDLI